MPRNGSGVYSLPPGSTFTPNTLAQSSVVNGINTDLATDMNTPRPIVAGGTGANTQQTALTSLGAFPGIGHDPTDITKQLAWDMTGITTATIRTVRVPDINTALGIWEPISYVTPSAAAVVFTNLSAFERLRIHGFLYPSVLGELGMQFSTDNGSTWISGAASYRSQIQASTGATVSAALATTTFIKVTGGTAANNSVINGAEFAIDIGSFNKAERARSLITNYTESNVALFQTMTVASEDGVAARNALRILSGASTFSGRILLEGMRG